VEPKERASVSLSTFALFAFLLIVGSSGTASAAEAVDIRLSLNAGENAFQVWDGRENLRWNLSLRMNGTDSTSITTPTFVVIDPAGSPAVQDGWNFIIFAGGGSASPPAYDSSTGANEFSSGTGTLAPPVQGSAVKLPLYGEARAGGASPALISVTMVPQIVSENRTHCLNVTAITDDNRLSIQKVRKVQLCLSVPADPKFTMGNQTDKITAAANSSVVVDFWLKNTGNTGDQYICNITVPRSDWGWSFLSGVGYQNITNITVPGQNLTNATGLKVQVFVPATARARENSTVSLNCLSIKALQLGKDVIPYPPYTRVEVIQFYWVCGEIIGNSTLEGIPGDALRFDFRVKNQGNGVDDGMAYFVPGQGNLSWAPLLSPDSFMDLEPTGYPGDQALGQFLISIPPSTAISSYQYNVNVTSTKPGTPICPLRFKVSVLQQFIPQITQPGEQNGIIGQEVVFQFSISNLGNGLDSLRIEKLNNSDWRVFLFPDFQEKILNARETFLMSATVIVPRDLTKAQVGIYNTTLRITSIYAEDFSLHVAVEANLSVIILPRVSCTLDPPTTEKELNPFAFPNGQAEANFLLALNNTGNGADSMTVTSARPDAFNVTATPERIPIKILETKAILVTIKVNATVPAGEYELKIVGTSSLNRSVNCTATFRMTLFQLDGVANTQVQSYVQNPIKPTEEVTQAIISPEVTQVEGYFVKFRVYIENRGDRALALGSATVTAVDTLECEIAPTGATNDTCGTRPLTTWTLPNNLIVGQTTFLEFVYFAPEYMCFVDPTVCARPDPPPPPNPTARSDRRRTSSSRLHRRRRRADAADTLVRAVGPLVLDRAARAADADETRSVLLGPAMRPFQRRIARGERLPLASSLASRHALNALVPAPRRNTHWLNLSMRTAFGKDTRAVKRFKCLSELHVVRQVDLVASFGSISRSDNLTPHLGADVVQVRVDSFF